MVINDKFSCILSANWTLPSSIFSSWHKWNECLQVKTTSMVTPRSSYGQFYQLPTKRIKQIDCYLLYLDLILLRILVCEHEIFKIVFFLFYWLCFFCYLLVKLIYIKPLNKIYSQDKSMIIFYLFLVKLLRR